MVPHSFSDHGEGCVLDERSAARDDDSTGEIVDRRMQIVDTVARYCPEVVLGATIDVRELNLFVIDLYPKAVQVTVHAT